MFGDRLKQAMEMRGVTAAELSRKTGISESRISHYLKGDYEAKQLAIHSFANELDISEAWLMGFDVAMDKCESEPQFPKNIGERIAYLRRKRNMTLEQVAKVVGVGKSTVRKWEVGIIEDIRQSKISLLAEALKTTPAYLLSGYETDTFNYGQDTLSLGNIIKNYRNFYGLSMDDFSQKSGISKAYISLLEKNMHPKTGKNIVPSIPTIKQAAEGMEMNFDDLFNMLDYKESEKITEEEEDDNDNHNCNVVKKSTPQLRLLQIKKERNYKQVDFVNLAQPYCEKYGVKLHRSDISQYLSGKVTPSSEKIHILALALNVSDAWLMGYEEITNSIAKENKTIMAQNLRYYTKKFNISRKQLCDDLQISYTTFADWYNGTVYPRIDKIELLANYFGISKSKLIEFNEFDEKNDFSSSQIVLSEDCIELLSSYNLLNTDGKEAARERIKELSEIAKYKKYN